MQLHSYRKLWVSQNTHSTQPHAAQTVYSGLVFSPCSAAETTDGHGSVTQELVRASLRCRGQPRLPSPRERPHRGSAGSLTLWNTYKKSSHRAGLPRLLLTTTTLLTIDFRSPGRSPPRRVKLLHGASAAPSPVGVTAPRAPAQPSGILELSRGCAQKKPPGSSRPGSGLHTGLRRGSSSSSWFGGCWGISSSLVSRLSLSASSQL